MFWYCYNCGKKNKDENKICTNCSKKRILIDSQNIDEKKEIQENNNQISKESISSEINIDLNNYCRNCGKELEPKNIICSSCGTAIIDDSEEKKHIKKIKSSKYVNYIVIIMFILAIEVLPYIPDLIYKFKVDNYIKNELKDYNNYKINFNERENCYEKQSPLFPFYTRIPDCYDYKYEIILNENDKVEASVYYYKKEGIKNSTVVQNIQAYEKVKKVIDDFLDSENLNVEGVKTSGGTQFKVKVPINFKENLNIDFLKNICEMREVIKKEWIASEIYLLFADDFDLSLRADFALNYKNSSSRYYIRSHETSSAEDINREISDIKMWIKRNVQ